MDLLVNDPEKLTEIPVAKYAELGGMEGAEVIMWLIMRGALTQKVKKLHQTYYLPSMTPIASAPVSRTGCPMSLERWSMLPSNVVRRLLRSRGVYAGASARATLTTCLNRHRPAVVPAPWPQNASRPSPIRC